MELNVLIDLFAEFFRIVALWVAIGLGGLLGLMAVLYWINTNWEDE